ncbi:MAG: anaerobic ribonucleoside-triphosphate reductase activating protein [bacterium]|nr:anaerobic ribonucleoside-triphosphate reductase activating protein [bacterium]
MQIAGIQKLTLVDFPGHVAATIFTRGCSFRCGFCHNPELVLPEKFNPLLSEAQIFEFLESRYGKLTGICITGGEPLLNVDCDKFISHLKALGFDVKLDTNGSFPERLAKIIKDGDVDYIAMDIKSSLQKYAMTISNYQLSISNKFSNKKLKTDQLTGNWKLETGNLQSNILKSIRLIMSSGIDYEFRTTVCHPLHQVTDFEEIGKMIKGAKRYFIQNYKKSKQVDETENYQPFSDKELKEAKKIMEKYVEEVGVR